ncbi:MAG: hypothetical protein M5U19_15310 [Microthrixaceae bacterium]|nr:hypothetical protein [Microthrixaceae bacterium]
MSDYEIPPPEPKEIDERLAMELRILSDNAVLKGHPSGDERCDNCLYYLEPTAEISYCWHQKLRILVGGQWWCQWWERDRRLRLRPFADSVAAGAAAQRATLPATAATRPRRCRLVPTQANSPSTSTATGVGWPVSWGNRTQARSRLIARFTGWCR